MGSQISELKKGKHVLLVQFNEEISEKAIKEGLHLHVIEIPFWKNDD